MSNGCINDYTQVNAFPVTGSVPPVDAMALVDTYVLILLEVMGITNSPLGNSQEDADAADVWCKVEPKYSIHTYVPSALATK